MIPLRSSHILGVEPLGSTLLVHFKNGTTYAYDGVSPGAIRNLITSTSPGAYLNKYIKPRYKVRKLGTYSAKLTS